MTSITRGLYTYENPEAGWSENTILVYEDDCLLGIINGNEGDWEKIENGADPVADGWEDGYGHPVADIVSVRELVLRVIETAYDAYHTDVTFEQAHKAILRINNLDGMQNPFNDTCVDCEYDVYRLTEWVIGDIRLGVIA